MNSFFNYFSYNKNYNMVNEENIKKENIIKMVNDLTIKYNVDYEDILRELSNIIEYRQNCYNDSSDDII